jgi:putative drug exporter of the RND superfamily
VIFARLGAWVVRRRWLTLVLSFVFLAACIVVTLRGGELTGGRIEGIESERAQLVVEEVLGHTMDTTVVAVFHSETLDPRDQAFQKAVQDALAPLRKDPRVLEVTTADDAPPALALDMLNPKARSVFALVTVKGGFKSALQAYPSVRKELASPTLSILCTGRLAYVSDLDTTLEHDLLQAELLSLPIAILVLLLVFRSVVAAVVPVFVGALAVVGGIAFVVLLSHVTDVADFTINICSLIGLGVAIDYSLFTVSRYREERAQGQGDEQALIRAMAHAGPVVCFSGLSVATGLMGLLFFPHSYLFSMGVGGLAVVFLAVVFAVTFLPALLAVLGKHIDAGRLRIRALTPSEGFWHRMAVRVMTHPLRFLVPTVVVLLAMGVPFLHLRMSAADVRILGTNTEARRGYDTLVKDFPRESATRLLLAVTYPSAPVLTEKRIDDLFDFSRAVAKLPHVLRVESLVDGDQPLDKDDYESVLLHPSPMSEAMVKAGEKLMVGGKAMLLYVVVDAEPETREAQSVVTALRAIGKIGDGTLLVGGQTATDIDTADFIESRTPHVVLFIVAMTCLILFALLGSVILPLKAILMNALSVAGSFGALVWVFQDGHLGLAPARPIEPTIPVLLFCVLFGLSMDYEVLMLSRMKEEYARSGDNTQAVAIGLEKTAGLITSAAAIMVVVFGSFALASVVVVRAVGFGMALAVALDATLVRVLLVPATMRLFGPLNWWAPAPLLRMRKALGLDQLTHGTNTT